MPQYDVVFYINNLGFFLANFRELVEHLKGKRSRIAVVLPASEVGGASSPGFDVIRMPFDRRRIRVLGTIRSLIRGFALAARNTSALHVSITIIPTMLFGIPNCLLGNRYLYYNLGMGTVYSSRHGIFTCLRPLVSMIFRALLRRRRSTLVVLNSDDRAFFEKVIGVNARHVHQVHGCGTDEETFRYVEDRPRDAEKVILVPARLIREKGILEAVEASRILRDRGVRHRLWFSSDIDPGNPLSLDRSDLKRIAAENDNVRFLGYVEDIAALYRQAYIVCLPSYREGLPNALVEAFATGRPVVTCDVTGCRDVVVNERNGLLVPVRDGRSLADALERLLVDRGLYERLRGSARNDFERFYTKRVVLKEVTHVFRCAGTAI